MLFLLYYTEFSAHKVFNGPVRRNFLEGRTSYKGNIKVTIMSLESFVDRSALFCSSHFLITQGFGADDAIAHRLQHLCNMFPVVINEQQDP